MSVVIDGAVHISGRFAAVFLGLSGQEIVEEPGIAEGGDGGHFRRTVELDTPGLVVGKMQLQTAHLYQGHGIYLLEDKVLTLEVAHQVEHQPTMAEARCIIYAAEGHTPLRIGIPHLDQRL